MMNKSAVSLFLSMLCSISIVSAAFVSVNHDVDRSLSVPCLHNSHRRAFLSVPVPSNNSNRECPPLSMFGGLFGGNDKGDIDENDLALITKVIASSSDNVKFDSLSDYIQEWSKLFETDPKGMRLTTPVQVVPSSSSSVLRTKKKEEDEEGTNGISAVNGVCLLFEKKDTGYKSKEEEAASGRRVPETVATKKKKVEKKKEGGVEILVEKLEANGEIQVRVRRCNFDEDNPPSFKEMSEESIVKELKKAIEIWKNK